MKKLFYLFLGCLLVSLSSCQSESSEAIAPVGAVEIVGAYSGNTLALTKDGAVVSLEVTTPVKVEGSALNNMQLILPATVVEMPDGGGLAQLPVSFSQAAGDVCRFRGSLQVVNTIISADGYYLNGKLTVALNTKGLYTAADIAKEYTTSNVSVKVSETAYDVSQGQKITVSGTDLKNMKISIPEMVVPGEAAIEFTNVVFTQGLSCTFSGSVTNAERDIQISGSYADGVLNVVLTPTYKSTVVGVWNMPAPEIVNSVDQSQVLYFNLQNPTGKVVFLGTEMPISGFTGFFEELVGKAILRSYNTDNTIFTGAIKNITFHADGNITADYNTAFMTGEPKFITSAKGLMRWYVKNEQMFFVPNLNAMTKAGISSTGIPLNLKMVGDKASIYIPKDYIAPVMSILTPIIVALPDETLGDMGPLVKLLLGEIDVIVKGSTVFDLGLNLEKTK